MLVIGPGFDIENEGSTSVLLGTPERFGHRAMCYEHEVNNCDDNAASSSGEPDPTDSSFDDDTVAPGGQVRGMAKGIEKFRRVHRHRLFAPIATPTMEDEPPGLHSSRSHYRRSDST